MKVTFQTLNNTSFQLDLSEDDKVSDVKKKITETVKHDAIGAVAKTLIHQGKVMDDTKTLKCYNVNEKVFIVVIFSRKPTTKESSSAKGKETDASKCAQGSSTAAPSQANEGITSTETAKPPTTEVVQPPSDVAPPIVDPTNVGECALVTGTDLERIIQEMTDMGFEKSLVMRAMRASYNNPDRAVEYLLSGNFPSMDISEPPPDSRGNVDSIPPEDPGDDLSATESTMSDDAFNALTRLPPLQSMRAMIQLDPSQLPQLMHQIGEQNPDLLQTIRENEQRFLDFLNAPLSPETSLESEPGDGSAPAVTEGHRRMQEVTIEVTDEEIAAIERLKALGFPAELVIQAYFACDKNEAAAANFLLSDNRDDEPV